MWYFLKRLVGDISGSTLRKLTGFTGMQTELKGNSDLLLLVVLGHFVLLPVFDISLSNLVTHIFI